MPPRMVKRGSGGPKRSTRAARAKVQNRSEPADEPEKIEIKEDVKVNEEKPIVSVSDPEPEPKPEENLVSATKEDEVKESVDDYGKDERLELDDNEPEYEPEEYGGMDYDEKEIEQEDAQEDGDDAEEDPDEEQTGEEEEGDMVEDEMEYVPEEHEGEEDDEHAGEEEPEHEDEKEHHDVVKERRKRKEFEIFVGGLDKDATESDLKKAFGEVGEITEVRLLMNPQTKKNKGFAFLRFATVEQAKKVLANMKNPMVNGKRCGVSQSHDTDTVFLGNICKTWTKEALKEKLVHYGVDNVEDLTLVEDSNNEGLNRGFAFLEFSSRSDAMDSFRRLQKRDVVFGTDRPAKVSFADSFIDPGDEIMAQVKTVFVDGLPSSWDEDRVREILKEYGEVEKVELARNMPSAKRKDFGFVTFHSHDAAVTCAKCINNADLGDGDNKVKVRARLSRPLQRGRGKYAPHGDFRSSRVTGRSSRSSWARPAPRSLGVRGGRSLGSRLPPAAMRKPVSFRDRRPVLALPPRPRARPLPPPARSYDRRPPVSSYPKSSLKRDYDRREQLPPRSRPHPEYSSRAPQERRPSYRDEYSPRMSEYPDPPKGASRTVSRRAYIDDGYGQRFERPPPSYREARGRDYDPVPGSKRPYTALDDVPPRYADTGARQSRARLDYDLSGGSSQYADTYSDRLGRSNVGYSGSRNSMSGQDSHGLYSSRQNMGYGGSYGSSDANGLYSSSYSADYMSRGNDAGGSSYSSLYSSRGAGGSGYMGSGGSGSYY